MRLGKSAFRLLNRRRRRLAGLTALLLLGTLFVTPPGSAKAGGRAVSVGPPLPLLNSLVVSSMACVDAHTCYVVGGRTRREPGAPGSGLTAGILFTVSYFDVTKEEPLTGTEFMHDLACSPDGTCVAIGNAGPTPDSESHLILPISDGVPGTLESVDSSTSLSGVPCSNNGACYAVGEASGESVIVPIIDGTIGQAVPVAGSGRLSALACGHGDTCYATGEDASSRSKVIVPVVGGQPGPTQLIADDGFSPAAIACPDPDLCLAVGSRLARIIHGTLAGLRSGGNPSENATGDAVDALFERVKGPADAKLGSGIGGMQLGE